MKLNTFTKTLSMYRKFALKVWILFLIGITSLNAQITNDSIAQPMTFIKPPHLVSGDSIAIVAPSGILLNKKEIINQAKQLAESWGLKVVIGDNVFNQGRHFAGTDEERAADFQKALDNPNIKAIWSARGGYGSVRMLDKLDYTKFLERPKWIIGYSDITGLHIQVNNMMVESLHAIMGTSMMFDAEKNKVSIESFRKALFGEAISYEIEASKYNKEGNAEAPLVGGNMTLLLTTLGSDTQLNVDDKILFIEEIGEYKYHIDRMLVAFKRAGLFEKCKGLIVGDMSNIKKNTTPWGSTVEQLVLDALVDYDFPILFGFPAGHEIDNRALIFGRNIKLEVAKDKGTVTFDE